MKNIVKVSAVVAMGLAAPMHAVPVLASHTACEAPSASAMSGLMGKLDAQHQAMLNGMDCEGQNLAVEMSQQKCKGQNSCKGLNSCKSEQNSCAGKGSCKGTSPGPFTDMNKMMDVVSKHMQDKRMGAMGQ